MDVKEQRKTRKEAGCASALEEQIPADIKMCCSKRDAPYHEPKHPSMEIDSKRTAMEEASLLIGYNPKDKPQFVAWLRYRPQAPQTDDCESSSGRTRKLV